MSANKLILDFLHLAFILILIAFFVFYIIVGRRLEFFTELMKALVPLTFFGIIFLIKLKIDREVLTKKKETGDWNFNLRLTHPDKFRSNVILFALPILMLLPPIFFNHSVDLVDILQACLAFVIFYFWQRALFQKI